MSRERAIEKLKEDIGRGALVVVAGTGVSVAASGNPEIDGCKVATWTGLLRHGIAKCQELGAASEKVARMLLDQVESGETDLIISAAETVSQRLKSKSEGTFRGWLKDSVGRLELSKRDVPEAVAALPGVLATLNYDNLLEDATGRRAVTWLKTEEVQEVLTRQVTDAVLHLHGWFREPESVVLGLGSYSAVKDHAHARAVLELFTIGKTLLFVGCGDTVLDPNFTRLIEWGKEALSDVSPRHYLLCRTSEIASFQAKLAPAPWLLPLDYGPRHDDLAPFLRNLAPAGGAVTPASRGTPAGPSFDLAGYQQAMRKRYGRLKLEELDPTTHDIRPLTLTGMFIGQNARECVEFVPRLFELPKEVQRRLREAGEMEGAELDAETVESHRKAYLDRSARPILEIVHDPSFSRLVVLGDPGSGKSTLLQYLLLTWAEKPAPDLALDPLPLLLDLREYARLRREGAAGSFLGFLHEGASVRWHFDQTDLDRWLKANRSLTLFDGLDEIFDPELRREVVTAIHLFADDYPLSRVVVTSRIIGFQHQVWSDEHFRHFLLEDLDGPQMNEFLARWHLAAYEEPAQGEAKRALLARALADSAPIRQLAGNPLLLTMMAILNRTQDLPRDRSELYEQCARLLLHQWKVEVAFSTYPELTGASLDFKDKRALLLRVARAMQSSERGLAGNLIDETLLEKTLAEGLSGIAQLRPDRAARVLIEQLRGRNFMLCSLGGQSYAFVHRTFLEYFCAVEIRERFQTEQTLTLKQLQTEIFGHWLDETWHEVLCLLAGLLAPRFVAEILTWLLDRADPGETCRHIFLAARCVGEVRKRAGLGVVEQHVLARTKGLTRFDFRHYYEDWEEDALAVAKVRARAVDLVASVWPGAHETRSWLKARAQSDEHSAVRQSAVQELARGWKEDPETPAIVKASAQSDADNYVRQSAMEALARGWKEDPETLAWLKALAQSDENWVVRGSAVLELARGWKEDSETLAIVKALAQRDADNYVRQSAVRELARGWKEDPETLAILKARAQRDEHWAVRQSAVQALARGWKEDPETPAIVKASAQSDADNYVRQSAMEALARGWKEDPETLAWLKALAQSDENWVVRGSAVLELARGWKEDSETLAIVKALAQSDADNYVRQSAVQELARGWKEDQSIQEFLAQLRP